MILDGGFGQQVTEKGGKTTMPLWATHELLTPDGHRLIRAVHDEYLAVPGIDGIGTSGFRAQAETFEEHQARAARGDGGLVPVEAWGTRDPAKLSYLSVQTAGQLAIAARDASGKSDIVVAASAGPIKDCYDPLATPSDRELAAAHERYVEAMKDSGVDAVFFETIPTVREAVAAARAAEKARIPYGVSFWGANGGIGFNETLGDGVRALERAGVSPLFVGTNCIPLYNAGLAVKELRNNTDLPIAVSANGKGDPTQQNTWEYTHDHNRLYTEAAQRWVDAGAMLVGGCCGTTPTTITGVAEALGQAA